MTCEYALRSITDLKPDDHICGLYETEEEHKAVLTPFLRQGLEQAEKLLYILDAHTPETILQYLRDDGVDVEPYLASGQLSIVTGNDTFGQDGTSNPGEMIAKLWNETERALAEGYQALRVTGEMTWLLQGLPGTERLMEYEAKLNSFFPANKCLVMCQYDRRRFRPDILQSVLANHPVNLVGMVAYDFH